MFNENLKTFITCHNQDIIKEHIESGKFNSLGDVVYMFVGMGEVDKIKDLQNVVIVRELPHNIEQYPNFTAFTAWYAIWKNDLCKSKYINLLEYDVNINEHFAPSLLDIIKNNEPKIISYSFLDLPNYHYITNLDLVSSIFKGLLLVYNIDMAKYIKDVIDEANGMVELWWPTTNNVCFSIPFFDKYMNWIDPLIPYMMEDKYAGHAQERALSFIHLLEKIPIYYYKGNIEHLHSNSHRTY